MAAALFSGAAAFAVSARFTGFFGVARQQKFLVFGSLLVVISLGVILAAKFLFPRLTRAAFRSCVYITAGLCGSLSALLLIAFSTPPPFPENHTLEIAIQNEISSTSELLEVHVISMERIFYPGGRRTAIDFSELDLKGGRTQPVDNAILSTYGEWGSISYQAFMQAGIELVFKTGPGQGIVRVKWDDTERIVDLQALDPPTMTLILTPAFNLDKADQTRKILVISAMLAEFFSLAVLLSAAIYLAWGFIEKRIAFNSPRLLVAGSFLLTVLLIITLFLSQPVEFVDNNLEMAVRDVLDNPDQPILKRQLLTIAALDASNRMIFNIDGIENLRNLSELNLSGSRISDISPLGKLRHLKKINLRDNDVSDLTPLANNASLEYLNLYGNKYITSIAPLQNLVNLETLILRDVTVRDEVYFLKNLISLEHLNLRSSGISDLAPLANLNRLQYLNLHSNPGIKSIAQIPPNIGLKSLILGDIQINDEAELLSQFTGLEHLNLRNTGIRNLSGLSNLTKLSYLNLHSNQGILTMAPLANLVNLETLILEDVPVGDQVDILANFPHLRHLNLSNAGISDPSVIGKLMANGAFKDDPVTGDFSFINIFQNPVDLSRSDNYASLRPFWDNLSIRIPHVLPEFAPLQVPIFSYPAGFYSESFSLEITSSEPGTSIHYTLDGSEPSLESPSYSSPIQIASRKGDPNILTEIKEIAASWNPAEGEVYKATIVRARAFDNNGEMTSPIQTQTYFVDPDIFEHFSVPVISLSTDNKYIFDPDNGIYVLGRDYQQSVNANPLDLNSPAINYKQRGMAWERPVDIEIFEPGGNYILKKSGSIRIQGHTSREYPQKSLRIYARNSQNPFDAFSYEFFPGLLDRIDANPIQRFYTLLLQNSGNDWDETLMRDALMQRLVTHTSLDTMAYQPVIVFLNGEYWGIHNLRQRMDEFYLASAYQLDPTRVVILEDEQELIHGNSSDRFLYLELIQFINGNDLRSSSNINYIQSQIDIDNYLDYIVSEVYFANTDWPHNNVLYWRMKTDGFRTNVPYGQDGRWRWIIVDTDQGFGLKSQFGSYAHNTLETAISTNEVGFLLPALLENGEFTNNLINRFADHLNTSFQTQRVLETIDQMQAVLYPEMEEHIRRWRTMGGSVEGWEQNVDVLREFARMRPENLRQQIIEQFNLQGTAALTIQTDPKSGYVQVNSIAITAGTPGVGNPRLWSGEYFAGVPVQIKAVPHLGYRFAGWKGTDQSREEILVTLQDSLTLQANFEPLP